MALIRYLTRIHFADGIAGEALAGEVQRLRLGRPGLLLTMTTRTTLPVPVPPHPGLVVLEAPVGFPTIDAARSLADRCRAAEVDGLIAIGSDDVLDLARATALALRHGTALEGYACAAGGIARIEPLPPVIALPLGAGRGAELSERLRLVDAGGRRLAFRSPELIPRVAIYDPSLAPSEAAAATEALAQAIEAFLVMAFNPPADALALDAIARIAVSIGATVAAPDDVAARRDLRVGAMHAALALQKGLGLTHAAVHALAGLVRTEPPLGALHAILLPHVVAFNAPAVGGKLEALATALGAASGAAVPARLRRLMTALGLPSHLQPLGLTPSALASAARRAAADEASGTNPRRADPADVLALLRRAMSPPQPGLLPPPPYGV